MASGKFTRPVPAVSSSWNVQPACLPVHFGTVKVPLSL